MFFPPTTIFHGRVYTWRGSLQTRDLAHSRLQSAPNFATQQVPYASRRNLLVGHLYHFYGMFVPSIPASTTLYKYRHHRYSQQYSSPVTVYEYLHYRYTRIPSSAEHKQVIYEPPIYYLFLQYYLYHLTLVLDLLSSVQQSIKITQATFYDYRHHRYNRPSTAVYKPAESLPYSVAKPNLYSTFPYSDFWYFLYLLASTVSLFYDFAVHVTVIYQGQTYAPAFPSRLAVNYVPKSRYQHTESSASSQFTINILEMFSGSIIFLHFF